MKKTVTLSSSGLQFPLAVEVRIRITLPAAVSAGVGTYVAVRAVAVGVKLPVPSVVHVPLPVELLPLSEAFGLLIQTEILAPALTNGALVMVTIMVSVTGLHRPTPVVVSMMATLPLAVSAASGIYVAERVVLLGEKVPPPDDDHNPPVTVPLTDPLNEIVGLFAQTV